MSASVPSTCAVWHLPSFNGIESLTLKKDCPIPKPGRGQVLVRVHAVSLNYRDLLIASKQYSANVKEGVIPCSDGAGEVAAVGEEVKEWKVGDRVAAIFTPSFQGGIVRKGKALEGSLGGDIDGMLAQYRLLDATALVKLPDSLSYEEAATLPCAGVTAWNALHCGAHPLRQGETVLCLGTGGVSVLAAQLALAAGCRVIVTSSSDEKLRRMQQLGVKAGDCINYKNVPEWSKKVRELTKDVGVDHVIEVGGPGTVAQSVASTRLNGEISIIGFVGGMDAGGHPLNPLSLLMGAINMRGVLVGSRQMFDDLLDAVETNHIKPVIDKTFPFEQAKEAYEYLKSQKHMGKVCIKVA